MKEHYFSLKPRVRYFYAFLIASLFLFFGSPVHADNTLLHGEGAAAVAPGSELVRISNHSSVPDYIRFQAGKEITLQQVESYLRQNFKISNTMALELLNTATDKLGFIHYRYQQTCNGIPLQGTMYLVHVKNGKVTSMNGMIFPSLPAASGASITESSALQFALKSVDAKEYRWQNVRDENLLKMMQHNAAATWYPKGIMFYAPLNGKYDAAAYKLCYRFDIYANEPLSRQYIFVDARTGAIAYSLNRLHDNNPVSAKAATAYSGIRSIIADSEAVDRFYLRDSLRGGGVFTLNLQNSNNYNSGGVNFVDADNYWDNVNADLDQYATDAHLGMEKTYDFYDSIYGRHSLDDADMPLYAYVHYDNNFFNAFWDGQEMIFGDGGPYGTTPLTTLDITGHECTHGVTQFTCNLIYSGESGGLNESFSDCAGEMVERLEKGANDWLIGAEIGLVIRSMSDPSSDGVSASSVGDYNWNHYNDPHYWSGPQNHWFYILSVGDTATNDLGVNYSVAGIGMDDAHAIAYRNQSVYLVPASGYDDARFYAIQAANDLFGACSQQVISCTNAWHAVGVGSVFDSTVVAAFTASPTASCSLNNPVFFTNSSSNGSSYSWTFGDGTGSTDINPAHQYAAAGVYTVNLVTDGGNCGSDSTVKTDYIVITLPESPLTHDTTTCTNSPAILTGTANGTITWYADSTGGTPIGSGSPFTTAPITDTTTYYAENDELATTQTAGPVDNNFGTGSYFTSTNAHYIYFDALAPFTLLSVTVYSNQPGNRTIVLNDNTGNQVYSLTVNVPYGTDTVTLNFDIPVGLGYQLGLADGSLSHLYRNQTGASYPYTLANVVSLTGNDVDNLSYYYYFYNWQVLPGPCTSTRVPVVVTPLTAPVASFTYLENGNSISLTNTSTGANSYSWDFGDGTTSTLQNPQHDYTYQGLFMVTLIACNGDCCDTVTQLISFETGVPVANAAIISVLPNPFGSSLHITVNGSTGDGLIKLTDVLGRTLESKQLTNAGNRVIQFNTGDYPPGIYFVQATGAGWQQQAIKVIKE